MLCGLTFGPLSHVGELPAARQDVNHILPLGRQTSESYKTLLQRLEDYREIILPRILTLQKGRKKKPLIILSLFTLYVDNMLERQKNASNSPL